MPGMSTAHEIWYHAAAGYLGMWLAMMVPMMLPSLIPMLARYRRSLRGAGGIQLHGLTVLAAAGYFAVWAALGMAVYAGGVGLMAVEARWTMTVRWLPLAAGVVLLAAGSVQFTAWKARQLAHCRGGGSCGPTLEPTALGALRHGLELGLRCSRCSGNLMLVLAAIGMMNLVAMAGVTGAVSAERLGSAPRRVAWASGAAIVLLGVLTISRA
jgi:predicted metal-binding membrane protein